MGRVRHEFPPSVKRRLAERVNYRCSDPDCGAQTSGPHTNEDKSVNIGVAAHITAAAKGGPRYNPALTREQRRAYSNGIWMCQNCGKRVDTDSSLHTVELLVEWKKRAEEFARQRLGKTSPLIEGTTSQTSNPGVGSLSLILPKDVEALKKANVEVYQSVTDPDRWKLFMKPEAQGTVTFGFDTQKEIEQVRRHLATGEAVDVRATLVDSSFLPPGLLQPGDVGQLSVSARRLPVELRLELVSGSHSVPPLQFLLRCERAGSDEAVFSNHDDSGAFHKLRIQVNLATRAARVDIQLPVLGVNANVALTSLRWKQAIEAGGSVTIRWQETGLVFGEWTEPKQKTDGRTWERLIEVVEALCLVQARTGTLMNIPKTWIEKEDAQTAIELKEAITTGRQSLGQGEATFPCDAKLAAAILDAIGNKTPSLSFSPHSPYIVSIFGKSINLGDSVIVFSNPSMSEQDRKSIASKLKHTDSETKIFKLKVKCTDTVRYIQQFLPEAVAH